MAKFQNLYDFVDRAVKSRKYPPNTAGGLKAALKLFEIDINTEERDSIEKFKFNLEQIYRSVATKNKSVTAGSLSTYRSRVLKVLNDYEKYGVDPTKMANWSPKTKSIAPQKKINDASPKSAEESVFESTPSASTNIHRIELSLRPDTKFVVIVPRDITKAECTTIKGILDSLCVKEK